MNETVMLTIGVLVCLQIKHFIADYLLQTPWIIFGKGHLDRPGGYVHAGIHALGSVPALALAGLAAAPIAIMISIEFVVHFVIDHTKALISAKSPKGPATATFWALHGADQCVHHLTYAAMAAIALTLAGV